MTTAVGRRGPVFDTPHGGDFNRGGPLGGLFGFCRDTAQGACAGLLSLLGATHMMNATGAGAPSVAPQSLTGLLEGMAASGIAGPVELIGAAVLFFTARRTIARTLGLLLFVGFMAATANGYSITEMLTLLSDVLKGAAGVLESIPVRESA